MSSLKRKTLVMICLNWKERYNYRMIVIVRAPNSFVMIWMVLKFYVSVPKVCLSLMVVRMANL
jgi:hypothetical protein